MHNRKETFLETKKISLLLKLYKRYQNEVSSEQLYVSEPLFASPGKFALFDLWNNNFNNNVFLKNISFT